MGRVDSGMNTGSSGAAKVVFLSFFADFALPFLSFASFSACLIFLAPAPNYALPDFLCFVFFMLLFFAVASLGRSEPLRLSRPAKLLLEVSFLNAARNSKSNFFVFAPSLDAVQ